MSDTARTNILARLRALPMEDSRPRLSGQPVRLSSTGLRKMMESVKTEFLDATFDSWPNVVSEFLAKQGVKTLLYSSATQRIEPANTSLRLIKYDRPIEEWKSELFSNVDGSITTTRGAIAETGTLIVWPSPDEPRLMSLVPPMHVALLDTSKIHATFADAIREERWAEGMPPNALLISGPSKTADIEQTLAYGVHGPKRLIVVLLR